MKKYGNFNIFALIVGFSFLYIPIILLILFSFNESRLVTVWGGFSTKWYGELMNNQGIKDAAWVTFKVAFVSSTVATFLGTIAGLVMSRFGKFGGRTLFSGMIYAPMVMPEVILGLSILLTFITLSIDRGVLTVTLAHITFSMCYVSVIIQSRMSSYDESINEAALDLGCTPLRTFLLITFPIILPAIISGWLLSFTMSLDDLVIASFTSGPGSTTLPMKIYSMVRLGVTPEINAVSTILVGLVALGVVTASIIGKRQKQQTI
ncbi:MAG: ABC transporter permease [Candidatus Pseudothioglobus sp.]|jgi:putrescine transport system permease protein